MRFKTMIVNFEFLGEEQIENVITCMHFKVDKVVYFGYHDTVLQQKKPTEKFLKKYCGVQTVVFHELSQNDLQSVLKTMRAEIQQEIGNKSKIYFDVTGGESMLLVAFGMLSKEFDSPMHVFDIAKDKLIELDDGAKGSISRDVAPNNMKFTLESYIEMKGGIINWELHKNVKEEGNGEFANDVARIWKVAKKHMDYWNPFSDFLRSNMELGRNLEIRENKSYVLQALKSSKSMLNTEKKLNSIVDDLAKEGLLLDVNHSGNMYIFRFKNESIKECIWEGGSILELHVYQNEKKISDDCIVGVHLDWDGVVHSAPRSDVINEIDVMSLTGNIPTFISCKSGKMGPSQTLHALYELDTVAQRFGGKYSKKVLVSARSISEVYLERAAEMGIEVR